MTYSPSPFYIFLGAAAGGEGAKQPRREVKTFDDVQTSLARAASARKQLVRAFVCVLAVGLLVVGSVDGPMSVNRHAPYHSTNYTPNPTQNRQHEAGEKRTLSLQEKRKQLTALQTNLLRDRQEVAALEKEIVSSMWVYRYNRLVSYIYTPINQPTPINQTGQAEPGEGAQDVEGDHLAGEGHGH